MIPDRHEADAIGAAVFGLALGVVFVVVCVLAVVMFAFLVVAQVLAWALRRPGPPWRDIATDIFQGRP